MRKPKISLEVGDLKNSVPTDYVITLSHPVTFLSPDGHVHIFLYLISGTTLEVFGHSKLPTSPLC